MTQTTQLTDIGEKVPTFNKVLGYTCALAIAVYLIWRVIYSLPISYGPLALTLGLLLYACELVSGGEAILNYLAQANPLVPERPVIPAAWYPHVDIMIATHDEEINLIYNTLNACLYMDYPDKKKVHIHLCDDGNRQEMRELAARLGVNYIDMPVPKHAKAGNMNNALGQTNSPLIAFLDADMIPRREFLTALVPYFFLPRVKKNKNGQWVAREEHEIDPKYKVGFVQTPQNFYNPDLFQYNLYAEERLPNEQIYFFRELNVARNRSNATHLCGSNMMISREAITEAGYFPTNNITEDHELGVRIQTAGWTTYAFPICLANGLNPPAIVNLIIQRERWGRGCMQTFYNIRPLTDSRIPIRRRLNYLCTILYWLTFLCQFVYIMTPILVAVFGVFVVECSLGELMVFWLPQYLLHVYTISRMSSKTRSIHWSNTVNTIMFPFLAVPILLDLIGIRLKKFKVTDKSHQKKTNNHPSLMITHILLLGLSLLGIVFCIIDIIEHRSFYNVIILFWLIVNSKSLLLSVFFMMGRTNERVFYRFYTKVPAAIEYNGLVYTGETSDLSEGGLSIALDYPAMLPTDKPVTVRLRDRSYRAEMQCLLVQVKLTKKKDWVYSLKLDHIEGKDLSNYRQIIYERDPSLPEAMNEVIPIIEDIKVNFDKRTMPEPKFFSRKLPRIRASFRGQLADGTAVTLKDFSYHHIRTDDLPALAPGETVSVSLGPNIEMVLAAPEEHLAQQNRSLYSVINWQRWAEDWRYIEALTKWSEAKIPVLTGGIPINTGRASARPVQTAAPVLA